MRVVTTKPFDRDFSELPESLKQRTLKQIRFLLSNPRHPSLRVKKMTGHPNIWECRVTQNYRFTFEIHQDVYLFRRIGSHGILKKP